MKIGILSSGGDCPGINATIRGVGKTALNHFGMEVIGIRYGFQGLLAKNCTQLGDKKLSGLLNLGGTILGTSREKPFKQLLESNDKEKPKTIVKNYKSLGLDCLVCIGGNGTQKTAYQVSQLGLNVIGIPKTIDNDVFGTDITFGFDSAVHIATEAIDRLHSTASSHNRVMVIELMGHKAGWITLHAGMAGGADVILLPELGCDVNKVNDTILKRSKKGKAYSIVAIGEGLKLDGIAGSPASRLSKQIFEGTKIETRETVLGYVQRGGSPSAYDRNLATRLGGHATELISKGMFGRMVSVVNGQITSLPLKDIAGKTKMVTHDNDLILHGERMGISFGV
ncbi:MAG: 6-phosphofructokinase [Dysgonamonadaceae bacterium]|jgi:6-phosphofructokinase 1|nr:6-phosphofructokinase [Dysgonamonadaceae bacterium]